MAITIGLILVIAGSLAFIASQFFGGPPTPPRVVELGFKCIKCANEFTMTNEAFQQRTVDMEYIRLHKGTSNDMADCPKCGEKHSALQMYRCPNCQKFFLPAAVNIRTAPPGYVPPDPVCPYCGTNMYQWHREHNAENKPR